ncbi:unnamed protein product, partial [marine sediment metagenome]
MICRLKWSTIYSIILVNKVQRSKDSETFYWGTVWNKGTPGYSPSQRGGTSAFESLVAHLGPLGEVNYSEFMLRFRVNNQEM